MLRASKLFSIKDIRTKFWCLKLAKNFHLTTVKCTINQYKVEDEKNEIPINFFSKLGKYSRISNESIISKKLDQKKAFSHVAHTIGLDEKTFKSPVRM